MVGTMDLQDYIDFAKENPICSLATLDGNQPRERTYQISKFTFSTMPLNENIIFGRQGYRCLYGDRLSRRWRDLPGTLTVDRFSRI